MKPAFSSQTRTELFLPFWMVEINQFLTVNVPPLPDQQKGRPFNSLNGRGQITHQDNVSIDETHEVVAGPFPGKPKHGTDQRGTVVVTLYVGEVAYAQG